MLWVGGRLGRGDARLFFAASDHGAEQRARGPEVLEDLDHLARRADHAAVLGVVGGAGGARFGSGRGDRSGAKLSGGVGRARRIGALIAQLDEHRTQGDGLRVAVAQGGELAIVQLRQVVHEQMEVAALGIAPGLIRDIAEQKRRQRAR